MKHKAMKRILLIVGVMVLLCVVATGIYAADYYRMDATAAAALESTPSITVTQARSHTVFVPETPTVGLIFYPGGKVESTAYAPLMQALAQEGILCIIPKMPLNLAVLDVHAAHDLPTLFPEIQTWYIGGHSLGGSMAASCAADNDAVSGLILLASYSTADLTESGLPVLSIYGTNDGVLNMEQYQANRPNLPADTTECVISGGNHAQFGSYGAQEGDGTAEIPPETQITETVTAILHWMGG